MILARPDIAEFAQIINDLAEVQDDLNKKEYQYKKLVATYKRIAMNAGAKTREVEIVEHLGNTPEEEKKLDTLMQSIFDRKRAVRILWGKLEAWKSHRDLYRSDSYHEFAGSAPIGRPIEAEPPATPPDDFFGKEMED